MSFPIILALAFSYLLGSIPAGYIAGKIAGVDVQKEGSGNIGATNILRVLGKKYGYSVFFFDAFKGFLAVQTTLLLAARSAPASARADFFGILAAILCVLGHAFPVWLKFKGGKGVATSAGAMTALAPWPALIAVIVWIIVFRVSRYVSLASVSATIALPLAIGVFVTLNIAYSRTLFYFALSLAVVVVYRHRSNFARLLNGTEQRFERK